VSELRVVEVGVAPRDVAADEPGLGEIGRGDTVPFRQKSRTAFLKALEPSSTHSTPWVVSRPRSTRSESRAVATMAFSVDPSQSPSGIFTPSEVIPSATTHVRPLSSTPPEHQGGEAHVIEAPGHQLAQGLAGAFDECA
jgi:hypothetical protein